MGVGSDGHECIMGEVMDECHGGWEVVDECHGRGK